MKLKKACVIGWPVSHSRSPLIHGYWLRKHSIEGVYERHAIEPGKVAEFLEHVKSGEFEGCNVTLPHKDEVFRLVMPADERTSALGVVNTVFRRDGKLHGTSTDGEGFLDSVHSAVPGWTLKGKTAVLLGAGGAARAIAGALIDVGIMELRVVNRTMAAAWALHRQYGETVKPLGRSEMQAALHQSDLLINTTSLGMAGQPPLDLDLAGLPDHAVVADIVYVPLETPLITAARRRGLRAVPGLGMLLHQAVRGFELWFGVKPEVTSELYDFIARDVDPEYRRA